MVPKGNKIVRKVIYFILFGILIAGFIYLGEKYKGNDKVVVYTIKNYYPNMEEEDFEAISGSKLINVLRDKRSHLVLIGSYKSPYSQKYIEEICLIIRTMNLDKVIYYDLTSDKSQKNSNYYEIRKLLEGNLITTDGGTRSLLSPSFYIIQDGKIVYYNVDTAAMKNTDTVENYWTQEKETEFSSEIMTAINKYYLNQ